MTTNDQTKSWAILLNRIEQNIQRLQGRLAELEAQKAAVSRMVNDPQTGAKGK